MAGKARVCIVCGSPINRSARGFYKYYCSGTCRESRRIAQEHKRKRVSTPREVGYFYRAPRLSPTDRAELLDIFQKLGWYWELTDVDGIVRISNMEVKGGVLVTLGDVPIAQLRTADTISWISSSGFLQLRSTCRKGRVSRTHRLQHMPLRRNPCGFIDRCTKCANTALLLADRKAKTRAQHANKDRHSFPGAVVDFRWRNSQIASQAYVNANFMRFEWEGDTGRDGIDPTAPTVDYSGKQSSTVFLGIRRRYTRRADRALASRSLRDREESWPPVAGSDRSRAAGTNAVRQGEGGYRATSNNGARGIEAASGVADGHAAQGAIEERSRSGSRDEATRGAPHAHLDKT